MSTQNPQPSSGNAPPSLADVHGHSADCDCPVHADGKPGTAPFGIPFASRLSVHEIDRATANEIYREHHSYMDEVHTANLAHHGVYFDDDLVAAYTYRYPLISRFKVYAEPGRRLHRDDSAADAYKHIISGDRLVEINRMCVATPMRNLASASLAASQARFCEERIDDLDTRPYALISFVRDDHSGSMLKAVRGSGWTQAGVSTPTTSGNREETDINSHAKQRWLCELPTCELRNNDTRSGG